MKQAIYPKNGDDVNNSDDTVISSTQKAEYL